MRIFTSAENPGSNLIIDRPPLLYFSAARPLGRRHSPACKALKTKPACLIVSIKYGAPFSNGVPSHRGHLRAVA